MFRNNKILINTTLMLLQYFILTYTFVYHLTKKQYIMLRIRIQVVLLMLVISLQSLGQNLNG